MRQAEVHPPQNSACSHRDDVYRCGVWSILSSSRAVESALLRRVRVQSLSHSEALKNNSALCPLPRGCWLLGFTLNLKAAWLDAAVCQRMLLNLHSGSLSSRWCDRSLNLSPVFVKNQMEPWVRLWREDLGDLMFNHPSDFLFFASLSSFCCPLIYNYITMNVTVFSNLQ